MDRATRIKLAAGAVCVAVAGAVANALFASKDEPRVEPTRTAPPPVTLVAPATFAGEQRLTTELARSTEAGIVATYPGAVGGLYGTDDGHADYVLVVLPAPEHGSEREAFAGFSRGLEIGTGGVHVGTGRKVLGVTCAPVTAPAGEGAACAWVTKRSAAYAYARTRPDVEALAEATVAARDAVDGQ